MNDSLLLKATKNTPLVLLDLNDTPNVITGCSMPENAAEFYGQVITWLDAHLDRLPPTKGWIFRLNYFNTSSMKGIYQVLALIAKSSAQGHEHKLVWDVEDGDEFMREAGENFQELLGLPIEFRELTEEQALVDTQRLSVAVHERMA